MNLRQLAAGLLAVAAIGVPVYAQCNPSPCTGGVIKRYLVAGASVAETQYLFGFSSAGIPPTSRFCECGPAGAGGPMAWAAEIANDINNEGFADICACANGAVLRVRMPLTTELWVGPGCPAGVSCDQTTGAGTVQVVTTQGPSDLGGGVTIIKLAEPSTVPTLGVIGPGVLVALLLVAGLIASRRTA